MNNWIFLRGLTRGKIHWGNFSSHFLSLNPDVRIEFLEIPGNGNRSSEKTPINPLTVIDLLRRDSRFIIEGEKFNLCGISLGGMVALKWAELYPEEILTVNVINTSLTQLSSFFERLSPAIYQNLLQAFFTKDLNQREQLILEITSQNPGAHSALIRTFADFAALNPLSRLNFFRQLLLARNIYIENITVKLTVISSRNDQLVKPLCSRRIAHAFGGNFIQHNSAGHDLPLDDPKWLSHELLKLCK